MTLGSFQWIRSTKNVVFPILAKRSFSSKTSLDRICIVGSGPAGFYTAKYILKEHPNVQVDMLESLPTPFGLVRSGVAPDHPEVKSVMNDFHQVADEPRFRFSGNVALDKDISIQQLQPYYNAIVLAYGAADDRKLNVEGENLHGVYSARSFVNWYNGHPDFIHLNPDISCKTAIVIGQGNVAIDCARLLSKTKTELLHTDISQHALDVLDKSHIENVIVIGRRGHVQASFTMKEVREITKLQNAKCLVRKEELALGLTENSMEEIQTHRVKKRMNDLLQKVADEPTSDHSKSLELRFLLSPVRFLPCKNDPTRVGSIQVERTKLTGPPNEQRAIGTGVFEEIPCGIVLKSIGYRSQPSKDIPFDSDRWILPNIAGRVTECDHETLLPGIYCAGWLKRGPSGIIGTNIVDAKETVTSILDDAENNALPKIKYPGGFDAIQETLDEKNRHTVVSWKDYLKIEEYEKKQGEAVGKPREKVISIEQMLHVAQKNTESSI